MRQKAYSRHQGRKTAADKSRPDRTKVHVPGILDPEQAAFVFSAFIAELQNRDVASIGGLSVYFEPYDRHGERMTLTDGKGNGIDTLPLKMPSAVRFAVKKAFGR